MKDTETPIVPDPVSIQSNDAAAVTTSTTTTRRTRRSTGCPTGSFSSSSNLLFEQDSDDYSAALADSSQETPARRRRVWGSTLTTTSGVIPAKKAVESSRFLDYQPDLTPKMRAILMDWIIELSEHFNFGPSTLHLACTLVDQVLACGPLSFDDDEDENQQQQLDNDGESKTNCFLISRDRFQLLGATCTWLACKMEELKPPQVSQIAYVSGTCLLVCHTVLVQGGGRPSAPPWTSHSVLVCVLWTDNIYSVEQIKRMERRVCNALGFAMSRQTPYLFIHEFLRASQECANPGCGAPESFRFMVLYLLELGRLTYLPVTKKPSLLAAAAIYLARVTFHMKPWSTTLEYYTGYKAADLMEMVLVVHSHQAAAEESNLKSCFAKYKAKKYLRVAIKTVPRVEDLGF